MSDDISERPIPGLRTDSYDQLRDVEIDDSAAGSLSRVEDTQAVREALRKIHHASAELICKRYGIGGHEEQTAEQIAAQMGKTPDWIREKLREAKYKLAYELGIEAD